MVVAVLDNPVGYLLHKVGAFRLREKTDENVFIIQDGSLLLLQPRERFHLGLTYNTSANTASFTSRLLNLAQDLMHVNKRWPLPYAIFWANIFVVPVKATERGPTVARSGYFRTSVMPIPRWIGSKPSQDVRESNEKYRWDDKVEQVH